MDHLIKHEQIIKADYYLLKLCGSRPSIMYGLRKIHKPIEIQMIYHYFAQFYRLLEPVRIVIFFCLSQKISDLQIYTVRASLSLFFFCKEVNEQDTDVNMTCDIPSLFTKDKSIAKKIIPKIFNIISNLSCFVFDSV